MEFGHFCLPTYFPDVDGSVGDFMRRFVEFLVESEAAGFDSLWANEHHFDAYGGLIPSPPILLSALAQRTRRVRLGTSVVVLPLHNPIDIAEQIAMIDLMSNGRVEFGAGRGFVAFDYDRFGIPLETGQARMQDALDVILKAWSGEPFSHHGPHFHYDNLQLWPQPQQRPHPPVWQACSGTPASFENAGKRGFSILTVAYRGVEPLVKLNRLYRDTYLAAGHKPEQCRISTHYQVVLSENGREAKDICVAALKRYTAATTHTLDRTRADRSYVQNDEHKKVAQDLMDIDRMVAECRVIAGTPSEAVELLEQAQDLMALTQVDCTFYFGGIPFEIAQRSHKLFAEKVMPKLRHRAAARAA
jgi:natural product biosynthesis luciferase-like monooxygenase protein